MEYSSKWSDEFDDGESQLRFEDLHPERVRDKKETEDDSELDFISELDFDYSTSFCESSLISPYKLSNMKSNGSSINSTFNLEMRSFGSKKNSVILKSPDIKTFKSKQRQKVKHITAENNSLLFEEFRVNQRKRGQTPLKKRSRRGKPKRRNFSDLNKLDDLKAVLGNEEQHTRKPNGTSKSKVMKRSKKMYKQLKRISEQLENCDEVKQSVSVLMNSHYVHFVAFSKSYTVYFSPYSFLYPTYRFYL